MQSPVRDSSRLRHCILFQSRQLQFVCKLVFKIYLKNNSHIPHLYITLAHVLASIQASVTPQDSAKSCRVSKTQP